MLEKDITEALKQALKSGQKVKVSVIRMLISEIKNKKIADRVKELDDQKVIGLVQKMVRQHKESIEQFRQGRREDLVTKETAELAVLDEYLPEQIPEEEIARIISGSIERTGAVSSKDMGRVMSDVMGLIQGRADGKVISRMVKERLT
ncbi:MAG: GatB/YqeY domain-containing protein [Candidatus Makaraimicrobium thalassicum]|nr:MAG: GatB/YqeY domain-containing protein [Candidatus Omnitrophota bacterium]